MTRSAAAVAVLSCAATSFAGTAEAPVCRRTFTTAATAEISGEAHVAPGLAYGLERVTLADDAVNLSLKVEGSFERGDASVEFVVGAVDRFLDARGVLVAEDESGNACPLPVAIHAIYGRTNPATLCRLGDFVLALRDPRVRTPGNAACTITDLSDAEPRLPEGYAPLPGSAFDPFPCRVLTVHSPFFALDELWFAKLGRLQPGERLLFADSPDGGQTFGDFRDVTDEILPQRSFRPVVSQWRGHALGSPFKVTCALGPDGQRLESNGIPSGAPEAVRRPGR